MCHAYGKGDEEMANEKSSSGDYLKKGYSPQTEKRPSTQQQDAQQTKQGGSTKDQGSKK